MMRIRDLGWKKFGSGIRESGRDGKNQIRDNTQVRNADPDIGFAITQKVYFHIFFLQIS